MSEKLDWIDDDDYKSKNADDLALLLEGDGKPIQAKREALERLLDDMFDVGYGCGANSH